MTEEPTVEWLAVLEQLAEQHVSRLAVDAALYRAAWLLEKRETTQLREMLAGVTEERDAVLREYQEMLGELHNGD